MIQQTVEILTQPDVTKALGTLAGTGIIYIIKQIIFRNVIQKIVESTHTTLDNELYPLINRLVSLAIVITGLLLMLTQLGVNINAVLATLGASSLIIAYGFKNSLTNIISGLIIMAYRPFRVDDEIKLPSGERVFVLEIGSGRSKFYDPDQEGVIIIPNDDLCKNKIVNYTYAKERNNEK